MGILGTSEGFPEKIARSAKWRVVPEAQRIVEAIRTINDLAADGATGAFFG